MKKVKSLFNAVMLIILGALLHGIIQQTLEVISQRSSGNYGGELLILPLMALLVWLGWEIRGAFNIK